MNTQEQQTFLEKACGRVARTRSGLLVLSQSGGSAADVSALAANLLEMARMGELLDMAEAAQCLSRCSDCLRELAASNDISGPKILRALDEISIAEAVLLEMPVAPGELIEDVSSFVDSSFDAFAVRTGSVPDEEFEIDGETLEIFRSEADELLTSITHSLGSLASDPEDLNALWEIRRSAHTFKGAAGIVGLSKASKLAHRVEDLLDKMVEDKAVANGEVIDLLGRTNSCLIAMLGGNGETSQPTESEFERVIRSIAASTDQKDSTGSIEILPVQLSGDRPAAKPVVRVALDRLDDLIEVSRKLIENRSELAARIGSMKFGATDDDFRALESLFASQCELTDKMQEKLLGIRMVRFGTLETRLRRTVNLTCQDEGKKAEFEILTPDIEIDTQIIDALIEPLLHLLKNAVVHGIETPDTRRLIGKSERGYISVSVQTDGRDVILTVDDDGQGISASSLKTKAVSSGLISSEEASEMADFEAWELIFDKGLTTSETVNLNAGRGIGMNIVREAVAGRGGSVSLSTEPQTGTIFTIRMPLGFNDQVSNTQVVEENEAPIIANGKKVLVVDDSASQRHNNIKVIEAAGCTAISASDGAEALELLLNGHEFDLILSDVEMPNVDGWQFLEYVKTDEHFGHIPIVMITSLESDEHRQRAFELGASDYLVKPFTKEYVARVLSVVCETVPD